MGRTKFRTTMPGVLQGLNARFEQAGSPVFVAGGRHKPEPVVDSVLRRLRFDIIRGKLGPGERLRLERLRF